MLFLFDGLNVVNEKNPKLERKVVYHEKIVGCLYCRPDVGRLF